MRQPPECAPNATGEMYLLQYLSVEGATVRSPGKIVDIVAPLVEDDD